MPSRLDGKVAIITGAARGQGEAEARVFAEEGARVIVADVLEDEGRAVAADIGNAAAFFPLDVSDRGRWAEAIAFAGQRFGTVDVLVNNAAISIVRSVADTAPEEFDRLIQVNQLGPFHGMQAVLAGMRAKGRGSIVNVCSIASILGIEYQGAYGATKAALRILTKAAAREWAPWGIRVNAILPGLIDTPMARGGASGDIANVDLDEVFRSVNPMRRPGHVREVASLATFLASDESSYITGVDHIIDGGQSAGVGLPMRSA